GSFSADGHVDDGLREGLEVGGEFGERDAAAVDDVEDEERGEEAVTGGGAAGEDDVAGLLAAEGGAGGLHLLEDVLVADWGAQHFDGAAAERRLEAHVGHGGGDDGGGGEQAAGGEVARGEQEDGVAVDDAAGVVGEEGAVGVAVKRDAEGGGMFCNLFGYDFRVKRTAAGVDVAAVGRGVGEDDLAAVGAGLLVEFGEELRSDGGGGAVGAVDDDLFAVEREAGDGGEEELRVVSAGGV